VGVSERLAASEAAVMAFFNLDFLTEQVPNPWLFLTLGGLSVMIMAMAKAGFGGAVGLLSIPLMIIACGGNAPSATGMMLPILVACDYVILATWWGRWRWDVVRRLLPGAAVGILIGWAALYLMGVGDGAFDGGGAEREKIASAYLKLCIGVISLFFVAFQAIQALRKEPVTFRPVFWQATGAGTAAGFTSTLAHAAGPVTAMYLLPQRMPKEQYVATTVLYSHQYYQVISI
jgi:hypothetical protein